MLPTLRRERGISRHLFRVAKKLEKDDFEDIHDHFERFQKGIEEKDADIAGDAAMELAESDYPDVLDHLTEIVHGGLQEEFKHITKLKRILLDIDQLFSSSQQKQLQPIKDDLTDIFVKIDDFLQKALNEIDRAKRGEMPANYSMAREEDGYTRAREVLGFAKQIRRLEKKIPKLESRLKGEIRDIDDDEELQEHVEEARDIIKDLKKRITKEDKLMQRLILYDLWDLYEIFRQAKEVEETLRDAKGYPETSLKKVISSMEEVIEGAKEKAKNEEQEVRKVLGQEERAKAA